MQTRVAFLGLGHMGSRMATNVAKKYNLTVVWDPHMPAREQFLENTSEFRIDPKTVCAES